MPPILIADNDHAVSSLLGEVLIRAGLPVRHAYDGAEALAALAAEAIRVMICDLDMPRVSGHDLLAAMATWQAPPATLVISGYVDAPIEQRVRQFPFVRAIWRKPFDLLAFAAAVRNLASSTEGGREPHAGQAGPPATAPA